MGTVIENVRLSLQQRRLAVLEERERIGMDLHDGIIQSIYAVGLTLEHARLLMNETPDSVRDRAALFIEKIAGITSPDTDSILFTTSCGLGSLSEAEARRAMELLKQLSY